MAPRPEQFVRTRTHTHQHQVPAPGTRYQQQASPSGPRREGHPSIYVAPWATARRAHDAQPRFEGAGTLTMRDASGRSLAT